MRSTLAAICLVLFCILGTAVAPAAAQSQPVQPQQGDGVRTPNATMVFTDQTTNGTTVQLNSVNLSQGGFVAIHDANLTDANDTVGSVIGVSEKLGAGPHQDVRVRLYGVDGREFNQSRLRTNGSLTAMAHFDSNGNDRFDFVRSNGSVDGPYVAGTGTITESAVVSVEREETTPDSALDIGLVPIVAAGLVVVLLIVLAAVVVRRRR
ncbi:DUF7282 domain-containing protein [Halococcus qingdaonensis]|uniref:DUF7282 domain-containing protein n=1 Tax=Halococcus qingdaonensis TaxID=224402 RepID=UPI002116EC85|nr:hypothetical protein [Halococcus qingdaonensis]